MDSNLTLYPISTGNELNVFSDEPIKHIKIMDMAGNLVNECSAHASTQNTIDIRHLPNATYIVEVQFDNNRLKRSVFVKT
ncbi:MAG: T9SS type A sorting domain-containing protein [Chitinophagales bacterium]|nr:T9SS type A sorting domain-containing protein [Chitinophagaceae bacterium]MCB9065105.1 T9SS type A sorting domain-containing protein [Chitinophagales bacterium]